jgi:alkanesulfonate monooxygenase SsuD/methylene tetrahydromethanopterin reductase-like flavin-dependent oxidoreductase (luciferase family)
VNLARENHFTSFWAGQHFLSGDYCLLQPMPLLARASAYSGSMLLGTSILLLPLLNPLDVLEQATTIDVMSNGNFILGVGLGYRESEILASGINGEELVERFAESIALIKSVWDGNSNFTGKFFSLKDGKINPRPISRPGPPILVGAYTDAAVKRAGETSDGWIVPPELSGEPLTRKVALYQNAMEKRHTKGGTLAIMRAFHVTPDQKEADEIRTLIGAHFANKRKMGLPKNVDFADAETIVGNSTDCVEMIAEVERRYRPDHLILLMGFRGITNDQLTESIRLAGKSVLNHFENVR